MQFVSFLWTWLSIAIMVHKLFCTKIKRYNIYNCEIRFAVILYSIFCTFSSISLILIQICHYWRIGYFYLWLYFLRIYVYVDVNTFKNSYLNDLQIYFKYKALKIYRNISFYFFWRYYKVQFLVLIFKIFTR